MPKVSEAYRESRRDQILNAALHLVAANGVHGTAMSEIIAASGLSAGAIYGYFPSKRELVLAVAQRVFRNRRADLAERMQHAPVPDPDEVVRLLMAGIMTELHDTRLVLQLWGESISDPLVSEIIDRIFDDLRSLFLPYLAAWARDNRGLGPDAAAAWANRVLPAMLAIAQGYIVQSALIPGFDAEGYLDSVRAVFG